MPDAAMNSESIKTEENDRIVFLFTLIVTLFSVIYFDTRGINDLMSFGGQQLKTNDLATLAIVPLLFIYARRGLRFSVLMWVYFGLYALSMARGVLHSPVHAYNAFRLDAVFIAAFLACAAGLWESLGFRTIRKIFTIFALALGVLVLARMVLGFNAFVAPNPYMEEWVIYNDGRFLNSPSVVVMSIAVVLRVVGPVSEDEKSKRFRIDLVTLLIFILVVLSGQRTAAVGLLAALAPVFFSRARWITGLALTAIPLAFLVLALAGLSFDPRSIEQMFGGKQGTLEYRTMLWAGYFSTLSYTPVTDFLFGSPLGYRPYFYVRGRYWDGSLHSGYIGTIVNVGLVGTLALIGAMLGGALRAYIAYMHNAVAGLRFRPELILAFVLIFLTFGISYEWRGVLGFLVGTATILAAAKASPAQGAARGTMQETQWLRNGG